MDKNKALVIGVIVLGATTAFLSGYVIATAGNRGAAPQAMVQSAAAQEATAPDAKADTAKSQPQAGAPCAAAGSASEQKGITPPATASAQQDKYIGEEQAQAKALAHANLAQEDVTIGKIELDYEQGQAVYEVEFYKDATEYDYIIDATNGAVLGYDYDARGHHREHTNATQQNLIGEDAAKKIALHHACFAENQVQMKRIRLDHDDGLPMYQVKFLIDSTEYNYEIDAENSTIVSYEVGN